MKPMSEVFELPVEHDRTDDTICESTGRMLFDSFNVGGFGGYEMEHAAHAINSHDSMVDMLIHIKGEIQDSDGWWMDCPDRGGFDLDAIDALIKQARGE